MRKNCTERTWKSTQKATLRRGMPMKSFDKGVSYYTRATAEIGFPEDDVCCHWCPLMTRDPNLRDVCSKTGEILLSAKHTIGFNCPLNFRNEENEDV